MKLFHKHFLFLLKFFAYSLNQIPYSTVTYTLTCGFRNHLSCLSKRNFCSCIYKLLSQIR